MLDNCVRVSRNDFWSCNDQVGRHKVALERSVENNLGLDLRLFSATVGSDYLVTLNGVVEAEVNGYGALSYHGQKLKNTAKLGWRFLGAECGELELKNFSNTILCHGKEIARLKRKGGLLSAVFSLLRRDEEPEDLTNWSCIYFDKKLPPSLALALLVYFEWGVYDD